MPKKIKTSTNWKSLEIALRKVTGSKKVWDKLRNVLVVVDQDYSETKTKCACGQNINNWTLMEYMETGKQFVVGCDCLKRIETKTGQSFRLKCTDCNVYYKCTYYWSHLRTETHRQRVSGEFVKFVGGRYKGRTLKYVLKKDEGYIEWLYDMSKQNEDVEIYNCPTPLFWKTVKLLLQ
jgi:hypothetical protein